MARKCNRRDFSPTLDAAKFWIDNCLIQDKSLFSHNESLWTKQVIEEVKVAFVDHPDDGNDSFDEKIVRQMHRASAVAKKLMAEMLYAIYLFQEDLLPQTKRNKISEIWRLSGEELPVEPRLLSDDVLLGIGRGGQGYQNQRWREVNFIISLAKSIKEKTPEVRSVYGQIMLNLSNGLTVCL